MEGGVTRKRGYLWLIVLMLAVVIGLLFSNRWQDNPRETALPPDDSALLAQASDLLDAQPSRHYARHYKGKSPLPAPSAQQAAPAQVGEARPYGAKRVMVEINSADTEDFKQLYGIGSTFARRIVKYRALLGGFVSKRQLLEVYNLDEERYAGFKDQLLLDTALIERIDINTATIDQLKRHPYLDYYQAKAIVRLRESNGPFRRVEDLSQVALLDNETLNKLSPYITCNILQSK